MTFRDRRVLIVGATSAVAGAVARKLATQGARLYLLGGRSQAKLDELRAALGGSVVGATTADIDACNESEAHVARAIEALGGLDVLFVATGLLGDQLASEASFTVAEGIYRTNLHGVVSVLIPVANHFERVGGGRIVVISSVAADRGRPRNYTYASAKAALNVYLEGVRSRLYGRGTIVQVVKLGPVDTPMTVDHPKNALFAQPNQVADAILRGMEGNRFVLYVPWFWTVIMWVVRNLPQAVFHRFGSLSGR